jgi:hypothetical protein
VLRRKAKEIIPFLAKIYDPRFYSHRSEMGFLKVLERRVKLQPHVANLKANLEGPETLTSR